MNEHRTAEKQPSSKDLLDQIAHWANQIPEAGPIRALLAQRPAHEPPADQRDTAPDVCEHGIRKPWECQPCADAAWEARGASQPPGPSDRQRLEHYWKFCNVLTHPSYMDFQDWLKSLDDDKAERCPPYPASTKEVR